MKIISSKPLISYKRKQLAYNPFTGLRYKGFNLYLNLYGERFATYKEIDKAGHSIKFGVKPFFSLSDDGQIIEVYNLDDTTYKENSIHTTINFKKYLNNNSISLCVGDYNYSITNDTIYYPIHNINYDRIKYLIIESTAPRLGMNINYTHKLTHYLLGGEVDIEKYIKSLNKNNINLFIQHLFNSEKIINLLGK